MTDNLENLTVEHLPAIRADLGSVKVDLADLKTRVGSLEEHAAGMRWDMSLLHADIADTHKRLDQQDQLLERLEHRLDLREAH